MAPNDTASLFFRINFKDLAFKNCVPLLNIRSFFHSGTPKYHTRLGTTAQPGFRNEITRVQLFSLIAQDV